MSTGQDYGNLLYHASVVGGLTLGYNILAKKLLKAKPAELDKFDIADSAKLVGSVALAMWTRDMLIKQGYLKPDIGKL
jgi:hypothetical protein